jgi:hypothetical protein
MVLAEVQGGAQILVQSDLHERSSEPGLAVRIEGSDGAIEATEAHARVLNASSGGWRDEVAVQDVDTIGGRANGRQVGELLRWLEGGPEHRCAARIARETTEVIMAAYESARRHRVVHVPLDEPGYPLGLMVDEGALVPRRADPYDIRAFLLRDRADENRYSELRAEGLRHHEIMLRLDAEKHRP